jgi:hypothetical protein
MRKTPVVLSRPENQANAAPTRVNHNRLPTDQNKNGMNALGSVMKAAG